VVRVPADLAAAERARWLGEIVEALEEAQMLIWRLGLAEVGHMEVLDLLSRLETTRGEARALRLGRVSDTAHQPDPKWTIPVPWAERCT
jgi:hypothetical protein